MQKLNLPEYSFRIKNQKEKPFIFDSIRKKFVRLTPEEWVRQNFIQFLISEKKFPGSLISVETKIIINTNPQRADLIVYGKEGNPICVAEFKAPDVKITQFAFDQIARYNMKLKVKYLIVSNGLEHFCCVINCHENSYSFIAGIPDYNKLL